MKIRHFLSAVLALLICAPGAQADPNCDAQCQIARKAQDPLANIRALVFDNTIALDGERDPLSYAVQMQPVYSLPTEGAFNVILRATLPVIGVRNGVVLPPLGPDPRGGASYSWGLSDSMLQAFFSPKTEGDLKFGIGPQVSLRTRTRDELAGPGWGAGLAAVVTGFSGRWSYAAIIGQHWGQNDYSVATLNPVLIYNSDLLGGSYIGYSNTITHNWRAAPGQKSQIPLGLTWGKTFARENGSAVDVNLGYYRMIDPPNGAPTSQVKFGVTLIWP